MDPDTRLEDLACEPAPVLAPSRQLDEDAMRSTAPMSKEEARECWRGLVPLLREDRHVIQALEGILCDVVRMALGDEHEYLWIDTAEDAIKMIRVLRSLPTIPPEGVDFQFSIWIHREDGSSSDLDLRVTSKGVDFAQWEQKEKGGEIVIKAALGAKVGDTHCGDTPRNALAWMRTVADFALSEQEIFVFNETPADLDLKVLPDGSNLWDGLPHSSEP